jgi:hypothetical protein
LKKVALPIHAEVESAVQSVLDSHQRSLDASSKKGPMSESLTPIGTPRLPDDVQAKFRREDCSKILRTMCEQDPNRVVSRNYFRVWSGINESTWNRHFGTFQEFKRQAGIVLSRQVHKLEREIAKHASVDHYRKLTEEAGSWGETYVRPSGKRFQTLLVASDLHDVECDPFALRVFLDTAQRVQPETVVLGGDVWDLPEFGRYFVHPRTWDVSGRMKFVHTDILAPLRSACPSAQIDLISGNHEQRLLRHLADQTPALMCVLDELLGLSLADLFGLKKYEVNLIAKSDLSSWTKKDQDKEIHRNFKIYNGCFLVHHFKEGMRKNFPGCHGHSHKHLSWSFESPQFGAYEWHQLGCMHKRDAGYTDGERWSLGFALVHIDTQKLYTNVEYVPITDHAVVGGRYYLRGEKE